MNKEVQEIIVLGKDSIVQLALKLLDERASTQNFSKIKVLTDGKEVYVSFRNPIKYLPMASEFYFDGVVNVLEKTTTYSAFSNGFESNGEIVPLYKPTKQTEMNIQFVIEAINNNDEVGSFDITNFEEDMIIREHENYYDISVVSEFQESSYKVEKISGKVYDASHAHLVPPPFESENKDTLTEIN